MATGSEYWTEFAVPTAVLTQDTITEPTEEYGPADVDVSVITIAATLTLNSPTPAIYSLPSTLALGLTINAPTILTSFTVAPATVEITSTLNAPVPETIKPNPVILSLTATAEAPVQTVVHVDTTQTLSLTVHTPTIATYSVPATVPGVLTILTPVPIIEPIPTTVTMAITAEDSPAEPTATPATVEMTASTEAPTPVDVTTATLLNLGLTINSPLVVIKAIIGPVLMTVSAGFSPTVGSLAPTIVRYIKDPIKTGGCAQCGTFLYESVRGREVRGEVVKRGRNFDLDKGRREDRYIKCGRCGWTNHLDRAVHVSPDSSRMGWGLKYEEIEAGESDISYP